MFIVVEFCEKRRGLLRALPWNILLVLNSDFYYFYFPVLKIGPWANPINDRLMFRFTMIHVEIITPCAVEITQYALKGQKLLAQGDALGDYGRQPVALKGQKH